MNTKILAITLAAALASAPFAYAQRAGQSVTIQHGVVTGGRQVDLSTGAVPKGALVGGALGLASARNGSSSRRARNTLIGAAAGGAVAGSAQGDTRGMIFEVKLIGNAGVTQVVTDQREIRVGDCVAVERAGDTANVRRVSDAFCESANQTAVAAIVSESTNEANKCFAAKQEVVNATTPAEAELGAIKMRLLCDD